MGQTGRVGGGWRGGGRSLGPSWKLLGMILRPMAQRSGGERGAGEETYSPSLPSPSEAQKWRLGTVVERYCARLGRSWGSIRPSWRPLGALLGKLGDILSLP